MSEVTRAGVRRLGGFAALVAVALVPTAPADADQPSTAARGSAHHIGIVITGTGGACVAWHPGITGDEVLNAVARVNYRSDGVIVQIDGRPASGTADDTHYWAYWHDTGSRWSYSRVGASSYQPGPGDVEGWNFDNGSSTPPPPPRDAGTLYASLCAAADSGSSAPSPRMSPTASQPGGTPAPTLVALGVVAVLAGGGWIAARRRRSG